MFAVENIAILSCDHWVLDEKNHQNLEHRIRGLRRREKELEGRAYLEYSS